MLHKQQIRLKHLFEHFPLRGSYIFRFKVQYDNVIAWLDLSDAEAKLPMFKDKIVVKATRVSWEEGKTADSLKILQGKSQVSQKSASNSNSNKTTEQADLVQGIEQVTTFTSTK